MDISIIRVGTVPYRTVPYATISYRIALYRTLPYRTVALDQLHMIDLDDIYMEKLLQTRDIPCQND